MPLSVQEMAHHHGLFDIDEDALLISLRLFVEYTLSYLSNSDES